MPRDDIPYVPPGEPGGGSGGSGAGGGGGEPSAPSSGGSGGGGEPAIFDNSGGSPLTPGSGVTLAPDEPGDLGSSSVLTNTSILTKEAYRKLKNNNLGTSYNHRYRGHREAPKFNSFIQKILLNCVRLGETIRLSNTQIETAEASFYPTDAELAQIAHIREQIRFKEWLLLKDVDQRWWIR